MRILPFVLAASAAFAFAGTAAASYPDGGGYARAEPVGFAVPLRGPLESRFGSRWGRLHAGLDIAVLGTNGVRAADDGVVVATGWLDGYAGYGNVVRIRHRPDLVTMYAHLATIGVRVGERVERGQPIASAGCTGSCTGAHLHFEVQVKGRPVNPLPFLHGRLR